MDRLLTCIAAALEAAGVAVGGIVVLLTPTVLVWMIHGQLAGDWHGVWAFIAGAWLLAHGVPLDLALDAQTAVNAGLPATALSFPLTLAPLGLSLLTIVLGAATGRRAAQSDTPVSGLVAALVGFAAVSAAIAMSASTAVLTVDIVLGIVVPPLVYGFGLVVGFLALSPARRAPATARLLAPPAWLADAPDWLVEGWKRGWRSGLAAAAGLVALSAAVLGVTIAVRYSDIVAGYEALQPDALGILGVSLGQAAFLPNAVAWTMSWLLGPGFSLGAGSIVSPVETSVGPAPAVPLLAAIPLDPPVYASIGMLVPLLAGFLAGHVLAVRPGPGTGWTAFGTRALGVALTVGIGAGAAGVLAWTSSGAAGPDRLEAVGPDPWAVLAWAAVLVGIGSALGAVSGTLRARSRNERAEDEPPGDPREDIRGEPSVRADGGHPVGS